MGWTEKQLRSFVGLVEAAEESFPYATVERLGRLARSQPDWAGLSGELRRLVRDTVADQILLTDTRQRLTRSGAIEPIDVYRLNRRHPLVASLAD